MTHQEFLIEVTKRWAARAQSMGWNPKSVTYQKAQMEYFMGAYVAGELLGCPLNSMILVLLSVGRDMTMFLKEKADAQPG